MFQKGLSTLTTVLIIVVLLIIGYFLYGQTSDFAKPKGSNQVIQFSPTPANETSNWKTYTSKKYGYSLKYPSDWSTLSPGEGTNWGECINSTDQDSIIEFTSKALENCGFQGDALPNPEAEITIDVLDKPWIENQILTTDATEQKISSEITLVGEKATKTPFTEKSYRPNIMATRIYLNHNNKGYLIFLKQTDEKGNYPIVYDQILSTFKFVE